MLFQEWDEGGERKRSEVGRQEEGNKVKIKSHSHRCQKVKGNRTEQNLLHQVSPSFERERERAREIDSEKRVEDSSVNKSLELLGKQIIVPDLEAQMLPCVCSLKRVSGKADRVQSCPYYPQSRAPDSPDQAQIWKLQ